MPLTLSSSKAKVKAAMEFYLGVADDETQAEKFHDAIAKAINDILLTDAQVNPSGMQDAESRPITGTGTIL